MRQFTDARTKPSQLRQHPLEDRRGSSTLPTSTRPSTGTLRCQGGGKGRIFDYSVFSGTGNLKKTRQLHWTSGHFLFHLSWRWMLSAGTSNLTGWSSKGRIIKLPLFHKCWYADTVLWEWFTRSRPHSTQSIPLLARNFHDTTPIKCFLKHDLSSVMIWLEGSLSTWDHGAFTELPVMLS